MFVLLCGRLLCVHYASQVLLEQEKAKNAHTAAQLQIDTAANKTNESTEANGSVMFGESGLGNSGPQNRPKLYKIKKDMDAYYFLCLDHREILTIFYDYYMDFKPSTMRKIFTTLFQVNKLVKLLLVYFLFYHTVWWANNSTSNNLATTRTELSDTKSDVEDLTIKLNGIN